MDRNAAYANVLRAHCPQAAGAYDLFHVVAKYGREVIDRAGVDEANRLRRDKRAHETASAARPLDTRLLEGINKEIKVIKPTAYGFRDAPCSALRIGAAFPGAPR